MDYKDKITKKGLKQKWVADQLGVSEVMLSYYINNVRPIPESISLKLKELLN